MKTRLCITLLLASILSAQPALTSTNSPPSKIALLPIIVLTAAAVGTLLIVKAYKANGGGGTIPRLCLEKSTDRATWETVTCMTNVTLNGTNPIVIFEGQMTDSAALYRARCYPE